jgi:CRISPR/Cas system-associated exonuclease Cas4 (RecB family)
MPELRNEFSWSVSRHRAFSECRRQYYFRHYGSWGGWDPRADPFTRELYILKQLGNRYTFAGQVVHGVVADVLNRHRYGRETGLDEAKDAALTRLREGFQESRSRQYRVRPKRALGLFEHEYEEPLADADWQRMRDRVYTCLERFFASKVRTIILETRIENWLPIDALDSFVFEGVKIYVAPDFALRNEQGNALLIDWKTGRPGEDDDHRMQLVCYGLFAREKWGVDPRRAIGELHYLLTGDVQVVTLDEAALEEGMEHMRSSIRGMKALLADPEANAAEISAFAPTEDRAACARCVFRRACWPAWPATEPRPLAAR